MKFKIVMTATAEYDVNPEFYDAKDPDEMLKTDLENFKDDPDIFIDLGEVKNRIQRRNYK